MGWFTWNFGPTCRSATCRMVNTNISSYMTLSPAYVRRVHSQPTAPRQLTLIFVNARMGNCSDCEKSSRAAQQQHAAHQRYEKLGLCCGIERGQRCRLDSGWNGGSSLVGSCCRTVALACALVVKRLCERWHLPVYQGIRACNSMGQRLLSGCGCFIWYIPNQNKRQPISPISMSSISTASHISTAAARFSRTARSMYCTIGQSIRCIQKRRHTSAR